MKRSKRLPVLSSSAPLSEQRAPFCRAFVRRVQTAAHHNQLWERGSKIIIAVSGGPDSLCLLDVMAFLSHKYAFEIHVAHVNYRLRKTASALDEALVRERAAFYNLPCSVYRPRVPTSHFSEERLREVRYVFFEQLRVKLGFDTVAVAHHEDDQAETVLLRLLRGAGLNGLAAMRPRSGRVIRPFLIVSREEILRYLKEQTIKYREDASNQDRVFLRNSVRHGLIPMLERDFQPNIRKVLARTAAVLAEEYALLDACQKKLSYRVSEDGNVVFSRDDAVQLMPSLLAWELRRIITDCFHKKALKKGLVDECVRALFSSKGKSQRVVFGGLKLERKGDTVILLKSDL